ncbi:MAG: hypothetical protein WA901_13180 [Phormidesmis sp.]
MEAQVVAALEASDYSQVAVLLKQWQQREPQNPSLRLYAAKLQEQTQRLEAAEKNYTKLLQQSTHRKIIAQARAGIERVRQLRADERQAALASARAVEGALESTILAIAPPLSANRTQSIRGFAQLFNLDAYTARMKVPSSGFRIYRVGGWGELSYFQRQLAAQQTPALCVRADDIKSLQTFQVLHFEALSPQPTVICKNVDKQLGRLSFDWAEVAQQVRGQLPIFEQVIDLGSRGRTVHKEKVQDYAQVIDLHLPEREIVLRMCDRFYQYQKGVSLTSSAEINSRIQWNQLTASIQSATDQAQPNSMQHNDFTHFGKNALEFINLLPAIHPNLDIDRRAPSDWDLAFHLYSSLSYFSNAARA